MSAAKSSCNLGFLTVLEDAKDGLFGGFLILNRSGRPLEFHCTAPVRANRAQQILYGPTLEPYLYGEQIGQTLVKKAKQEPGVICTDREAALAVREFVETPVALVLPEVEADSSTSEESGGDGVRGKCFRVDGAHRGGGRGPRFALGRHWLAVSGQAPEDVQRIGEQLADLADWFDLAEPFARIREAIEEARRGGQ